MNIIRGDIMSTTKERRNAYAYRQEYLKHNKGLFGFYIFVHNVEDH